jgi:hypothetical protein
LSKKWGPASGKMCRTVRSVSDLFPLRRLPLTRAMQWPGLADNGQAEDRADQRR